MTKKQELKDSIEWLPLFLKVALELLVWLLFRWPEALIRVIFGADSESPEIMRVARWTTYIWWIALFLLAIHFGLQILG